VNPSESSSPLRRLLDAGLYAPLGFLLSSDEVVADLAAAGRKQVAFSRSLGRAALRGLTKPAAPATTASVGHSLTKVNPQPVAGYAEMTAREVVALIATCSDSQRTWIRNAESAGKQRVTVMRAIEAQEH